MGTITCFSLDTRSSSRLTLPLYVLRFLSSLLVTCAAKDTAQEFKHTQHEAPLHRFMHTSVCTCRKQTVLFEKIFTSVRCPQLLLLPRELFGPMWSCRSDWPHRQQKMLKRRLGLGLKVSRFPFQSLRVSSQGGFKREELIW